VVAIITGEMFARYYLGLGNPPLSVTHPTIEYMYKPNQDVYMFGNHFIINQYGMRTVPFAKNKENGEFRIMVFGDSVINGDNQTDHYDLATSLIQESLTNAGYKNPIVGNISAGSWGPGNWLAYAKEYGFFDAGIVVLVISSHDYADNPTFQPLNRNTHPIEKPVSALLEGIERYLPRYLPQLGINKSASETGHPSEEVNEGGAQKGIEDLKNFLELARQQSQAVLVLQHFEKSEIDKHAANDGYQRIKVACEQLGIFPISLEPYFRRSIESGANPYRDNIHPNKVGQQLIAEAIMSNMPNRRSSGLR
jgi:lysophospholipase L1-like esterase